jgi:hypothetical protein
MITGMLGAVLVVTNSANSTLMQLAFTLYLISSVSAVLLLSRNKNYRGLYLQQMFYVIINVIGLIRSSHI